MRRRGFSLLELLVVLVVMGVSLAVVGPAFRGRAEADPLEAALRETTDLLRTARRRALSAGEVVEVTIDAETARFWARGGGWNEAVTGHLRAGPEVVVETRRPRVRFVFRPDGTALADSLTLVMGGRAAVVRVDPWLGEIHGSR